jgi:hypothetical protein
MPTSRIHPFTRISRTPVGVAGSPQYFQLQIKKKPLKFERHPYGSAEFFAHPAGMSASKSRMELPDANHDGWRIRRS